MIVMNSLGKTLAIGFSVITLIFLASLLVYGLVFGKEANPEPDKERFLEIAERISQERNYTQGEYDCRNFSLDLVEALIQEGYNAKVVTGWVSNANYCKVGNDSYINGIPHKTITDDGCLSPHAWVEVEINGSLIQIEATNGKLIEPKSWGILT